MASGLRIWNWGAKAWMKRFRFETRVSGIRQVSPPRQTSVMQSLKMSASSPRAMPGLGSRRMWVEVRIPRPPKDPIKWSPHNALVSQCSNEFILGGLHFLDPLGGLGWGCVSACQNRLRGCQAFGKGREVSHVKHAAKLPQSI